MDMAGCIAECKSAIDRSVLCGVGSNVTYLVQRRPIEPLKRLESILTYSNCELVHACQIQHATVDVALLADAFASKVCEATGSDPMSIQQQVPTTAASIWNR